MALITQEQNEALRRASDVDAYERAWRDQELKDTDWIVPITDHSQREAYLTYRAALRDWPSTEDFPSTRPVLQ